LLPTLLDSGASSLLLMLFDSDSILCSLFHSLLFAADADICCLQFDSDASPVCCQRRFDSDVIQFQFFPLVHVCFYSDASSCLLMALFAAMLTPVCCQRCSIPILPSCLLLTVCRC
jgi:hypothetical protein